MSSQKTPGNCAKITEKGSHFLPLQRISGMVIGRHRIFAMPERNLLMRTLLAILLLPTSTFVAAQAAPEKDGHEIQIWTGGGHTVSGGRGNTGVFNAGLRYGWILTDSHLPGFLRGRFEYAVDAVPVLLAFQPHNTAYGVGFDALGLKWNFQRHGRISPYAELTGGVLFTNHDVPMGTNTVNFMPQAAFGIHMLGAKHNVSLELRYMHISNAGLATPNPGINTVQVRLGFGGFFSRR